MKKNKLNDKKMMKTKTDSKMLIRNTTEIC